MVTAVFVLAGVMVLLCISFFVAIVLLACIDVEVRHAQENWDDDLCECGCGMNHDECPDNF